jgi:hypothetical protein
VCVLKKYIEFHDGFLDGLLLEGDTVNVFLSTAEKEPFVLEISGVAAVDAGTFKEGNIIFDALVYACDELTLEHMIAVHGPMSEFGLPNQAQRWLIQAQRGELVLLEINPSYGATCLVLARTINLRAREEWKGRQIRPAEQGKHHGTEE